MRRKYSTYEEYAAHQAAKLRTLTPEWLAAYGRELRPALFDRLAALETSGLVAWAGKSALCLGARSGAEVAAFHSLGCFAVGIDLNPGRGNRHVLTGDFHATIFPPACLDFVYTNALDHAYTLAAISLEVRRILRPGGMFVVDAVRGSLEGKGPGVFESFAWESIDRLVEALELNGFALAGRAPFDSPWPGEQLRLEARP
jgi:SAM-dependent methyltransferase